MKVDVRRAALTGFALLLVLGIVVEIVAARHFSPPYDWVGNTISDLGATTCTTVNYYYRSVQVCSPAHQLVNASMAISGLAMIGMATIRTRTAGFDRFAGLLWVVAGASTLGIGLIPLDVSPDQHTFVSIPQLLALPMAVFSSAIQYRGAICRAGQVVAVVGLVSALWLFLDFNALEYAGLLERIILWPAFIWAFLTGIFGQRRVQQV
ncbi:DUF998 domain-containing protein [Corynebacterium comes]|uniref:DUF998 domain-containing protein n=1 Tax=Corynebacterium comes TaxID=2675218 RepID=A0A6B8VRZ8_9CORY|nr:DUF998 domain-containing protein [Corynebacterium comes]QGU05839.1 hypothetical protein CETAM_13070 [Corynebacterium comes]